MAVGGSHRIHGAGIYANIGGILMVTVTIYSSTMDPMGSGCWWYTFHSFQATRRCQPLALLELHGARRCRRVQRRKLRLGPGARLGNDNRGKYVERHGFRSRLTIVS